MDNSTEKSLLYDIAIESKISSFSVIINDISTHGTSSVFRLLSDNGINVGIILQQTVDDLSNISFTAASGDFGRILSLLNANKEHLQIQQILFLENTAMISILGISMMTKNSVIARLYECMFHADIDAACRLVKDKDVRICSKGFRKNRFLLVSARQISSQLLERRCLDAEKMPHFFCLLIQQLIVHNTFL